MPDEIVDLLRIKIEKARRDLPVETVNAIDSVDWRAGVLEMRQKYGYTFEQLGDLELETELLLCGLVTPESYPKELSSRMGISKAAANDLVNEMNNLVFKKIKEELIKNTERKKIFASKSSPLEEYSGPRPEGGGLSIHPGAGATPEEVKKIPTMILPRKDLDTLNSHGIEIVPNPPLSEHTLGMSGVPPFLGKERGRGEVSEGNQLPVPEKLELETTMALKPKEVHPIIAQKLSAPFQIKAVKTEHTLENITKVNTPDTLSTKPKIPNVDPYREIPE